MTKNLTNGSPLKVIFFFALPMLIGNVFQQFYNFADSAIVGLTLGENALAAVGGTFPVTFLQLGIASGASIGCSIIISRYFAVRDKKIKTSIYTLIILVTLLGIFVFILCMIFLKPFLQFLDTPKNVFADSYSYIKIVLLGCVPIFIYNALTSVFYSVGDTKTPVKFLIVSTVINIVLDLLFIKTFNMGINGAALATLVAQCFSCIGLAIYFLHILPSMGFYDTDTIFDTHIAKQMSIIAVPSILQQSIIAIGMIAVQGLVNKFGSDFMAGYSAATKIDSIASMPIINISAALSTYIAQNMGAKKIDRIAKGTLIAGIMMISIGLIAGLFLQFFGNYTLYLFLKPTAIDSINYGTDFFKYVSPFYIMLALMFTSNGFLRGLGKMKVFTLTSILNITLRIIVAYALISFMGYRCIFIGITVGWTVTAIIGIINIKVSNWRQYVLDHKQ